MKTTFGIWLSAFGFLAMALPVHADDGPVNKPEKAAVTDVILTSGGKLSGLVVGTDGKPSAHTVVQIAYKQNVVATVRTDASGRYAVQGIRSGVHQVATEGGEQVCRCWYEKTAPPAAKKQLVHTVGKEIVRGQNGFSRNQMLGAATFALTTTAVVLAVADENPVNQGPPPPASP